MTWILMEIPCKKSVAVCPNWHQIPWVFHVIYPGVICFLCKNMTWIWISLRHGIFMAFYQKMIGFPSDRQNDIRKSMSHFFTGSSCLFRILKNVFNLKKWELIPDFAAWIHEINEIWFHIYGVRCRFGPSCMDLWHEISMKIQLSNFLQNLSEMCDRIVVI